MLGPIVSKAATELSYNKRSSYMEEVTTKNNWTFELGVGDGANIPICLLLVSCKEINILNNIRKMIYSLDQV